MSFLIGLEDKDKKLIDNIFHDMTIDDHEKSQINLLKINLKNHLKLFSTLLTL